MGGDGILSGAFVAIQHSLLSSVEADRRTCKNTENLYRSSTAKSTDEESAQLRARTTQQELVKRICVPQNDCKWGGGEQE